MPSWARGSSNLRGYRKLPRTHFFPSGMHQMMYQVWDFSAKVSPRVDHRIFFVICHSSHIWLSPSSAPPLFFVKKQTNQKKQTYWKHNVCSWSHSDVFTLCLCIFYRHKNLQCFPAHHMHLSKIPAHGAVILFFVTVLFHCSDNGFLSIWITESYREQGECSAGNNGALVKKKKKREALRWLITLFYTP